MAADLLEIKNLTLHYGGSQILNGISMTAAKGEVTCVMGTNGVGKTSLLKAISGTHPRSDGTYKLEGRILARPTPRCSHKWGLPMCRKGAKSFRF